MEQTVSEAPNIIFIMADDQGYWAMGNAGNSEIKTPNLDRIAAEGMRFDNFFCVSPVCSPARASILTGRIPSQHGIHDWICGGNTTKEHEPDGKGELIEYLQGQPGYTDFLAEAGYACGLSGKWHLGDAHHAQKGFKYWEAHAKGGGNYYNAPIIKNGKVLQESRYITDVITNNALKFLNNQKGGDAPFYLSVHYTAPHSPWGRDQHPHELYDDYDNSCPFNSVPDSLKAPDWVKYRSIPVDDAVTRRSHLSGYYAAVTAMDCGVGSILDWLDINDLLENTLVCFTSDNGMNMGHHGLFGKGNASFPLNMFEESVRVPFLMSQPGTVPKGKVENALLSHYDVMPTLLDCAGLKNPEAESLPGRSFESLLRNKGGDGHERLVVYDEYGPVRMVRTKDWKYVHRYPYGIFELYDLKNDPGETENRIDDPGCRVKIKELKGELDDWFGRYVDPMLDGSHESVSGLGQYGLTGPTRKGEPAFSDKYLKRFR